MALSLVAAHTHQQHQPSFFDLQSLFDPYSLQNQQQQHQPQSNYNSQPNNQQQQQQQRTATKIILTNFNETDLMEFNSIHNNQNSNHPQNTSLQNNNHLTTNNSQLINQSNRNLMSGFHHQHFGAEYEPVITFVDSPPNSEESWPDDQSKGSPGPQIIDVQTIYSNSGSRKRRMDWDPLDIGQSESTASAHTGELPAKISTQQIAEKDKYKKEKLTNGRGTWTDDIGFDLNAEFNASSYLNNESFMNFSSGLPAVLKQEPQTEQFKINKSSLNIQQSPGSVDISTKTDKTTPTKVAASDNIETSTEKYNNDLNDKQCACGSPQSNQQALEQNANTNKGSNNNNNNDQARNPLVQQPLLTVVDASKIEQTPTRTGSTKVASTTANSDDHKFQYILAAATSIATKNNEDTLTYLNQGQSYEIKLKKIGDLSLYRDKILKSVIKICFHERRLQYMEREQMQQWQASRPGERIIEVDLPLSYGLCHVSQPLNPNYLNTVEIFWDPMKEVGVYIKVNCISTEFTPKKHGGEKGVPFRLQIETYLETTINNNNTTASGSKSPTAPASPLGFQAGASPPQTGNLTPNSSLGQTGAKQAIHAAACQIKVFKLKGADRKHKQDREKIQKRPQSEQDKFQPSYECTIMTDFPLDLITPTTTTTTTGCFSPEYMKIWPNSPVHIPKYDGALPYSSASPNASASPIAINSVSSTNSPSLKVMDPNNMVATPTMVADMDEYNPITVMPDSTPAQVAQWLTHHRLTSYLSTFAQFSGSDIMRMSKEDLIQICGLADGIRMLNILRAKAITPRLTIYVSFDGNNYNAIYLIANTSKELFQKIFKLPGFYEFVAKSSTHNGGGGPTMFENTSPFNSWSMHSKYSGSGSNIFNEVNNKSLIYVSGPAGVHVAVSDEVLNNEIKDGSLYGLEVQNGKVVMKLINRNES